MTIFDYMAARPAARASTGKGKKARASTPSAQLLLFDLFAEQEQPPTTAAGHDPAAPMRQVGLFADDGERREVA